MHHWDLLSRLTGRALKDVSSDYRTSQPAVGRTGSPARGVTMSDIYHVMSASSGISPNRRRFGANAASRIYLRDRASRDLERTAATRRGDAAKWDGEAGRA
jgi:hypothetical protein